ncbi:Septin-1 [Smittium culicis]|uniref:Septin-1 n=1 Tax=Smittium culicis TaxID=133412 RepID=A0A1R1Y5U5_9FUNG|nr:Septin-1 [Smittium culicis]
MSYKTYSRDERTSSKRNLLTDLFSRNPDLKYEGQNCSSSEKLNIMVVGPCSVGKSTLLQTIINSFKNVELVNSPDIECLEADSLPLINSYSRNIYKINQGKEKMPYNNSLGFTSGMSLSKGSSRNLKPSFKNYGENSLENNTPESLKNIDESTPLDYLNIFDSTNTTTDFKQYTFKVNTSESVLYNSNDESDIDLTLIDTPGFDPYDTSDVRQKTRTICRFIQKKMESNINGGRNAYRKNGKSSNLVHVIIYMLQPNSDNRLYSSIRGTSKKPIVNPVDFLNPNEEHILSKLSKLAVIYPVIGKMDTLYFEEKSSLLEQIPFKISGSEFVNDYQYIKQLDETIESKAADTSNITTKRM